MAQHAAKYRLFYSPQCPNCTRFMDAANRVPDLRREMQLVNVHADPDAARGVTAVPTVVEGTTAYVGSKAFEWLAQEQFQAQVELEDYAPGQHGLAWSAVDASTGYATYAQDWAAFE